MALAQNLPLDLVFVWTRINNGRSDSRNALVNLAIRILSVIANSAGCERAFSNFGITHTKPRNKLSAEKVHKTGVLRMDLRRSHIDAGLVRTRRKRAFGTLDNPDELLQSADIAAVQPADEDPDFRHFAHSLMNDADAAAVHDDDDEDPELPITLSLPTALQPQHIPLALLFSYPVGSTTDNGAGLDFYWKGGLKNLEEELASYELQQSEEDADTAAGVPLDLGALASTDGSTSMAGL